MDPRANLKRQREIAREIQGASTERRSELAGELAELVVALDEWLSFGGFLPHEWGYRR